MVNFRPTGNVTSKTRDRLSLVYSLGYEIRKGKNDVVFVFKRIPRGDGSYKLRLVTAQQRKYLFSWLCERHDLKVVDKVTDDNPII